VARGETTLRGGGSTPEPAEHALPPLDPNQAGALDRTRRDPHRRYTEALRGRPLLM
jgi:hypothetical protein